jgi:hypothetical protein
VIDAKSELANILREAAAWLARPGNNFDWSAWEDADEALAEVSAPIATLDAGKLPPKLDLEVLFTATGPIQEVSLSSGWGDEFLDLAARFDLPARRAYRWSLVAACVTRAYRRRALVPPWYLVTARRLLRRGGRP